MSEGYNPYAQTGQTPPQGGYQQSQGNYGGNRGNGGGYSGNSGNRSYNGGGNRSGYGGNNSRSYGNGGGGGGYGGNRQGGGGFQKKEYSPEDIANARYPVSVVISGNENITDAVALATARLAKAFDDKNIVVRCGGMNGVDDVVCNSISNPELHLPFKNFNKRQAKSQYSNEICKELARRQRPDIDSLPGVQKAILEKNPRLVLGQYMTSPAQLVIVWSEDGCETAREVTHRSGNAGHIVKVAQASGVRVINLQRPDAEQRAMAFLETFNVQQEPATATQAAIPTTQGGNPGGGQPGYGNNQPPAGQPGGFPAQPGTNQPDGQNQGNSYGNPQGGNPGYNTGNQASSEGFSY